MQTFCDTLKFLIRNGIPQEEAETGCQFTARNWLPMVRRSGLFNAIEEPR